MDEFNNVIVRKMTQGEFSQAIEWAAAEGWNPGMHDDDCFYAADPNGFFLAQRNGEPVGCLSAVAYDDFFGFAGFYIVKPEWRSCGIGHQLIERASAYMGNRTIGNDAVVAQQESYKKYGFRMAYRNIRYRGFASSEMINTPEIFDLHKIPFKQLTVYDRGMFPAQRFTFLKGWIDQPEGVALGYVRDGQLSGYGVIRKCRQGYKIGPLFADDETIADQLFLSLTGRIFGEEYFLDVPEPNSSAARLVQRYNMQMVFETARMYSGAFPSLALDKIFGVTSFELG